MGMGLQCVVNLPPALLKNNWGMVKVGPDLAENCINFKNKFPKEVKLIDFRQLEESMDKVLKQWSRDSIRDSMLKHEKIFREQVSELHRLYRVQKLLMAELSKEHRLHCVPGSKSAPVSDAKSGLQSSRLPCLTSCLQSHIDKPNSGAQLNTEYNFHQFLDTRANKSSHIVSVSSGERNLTSSSGFKKELDGGVGMESSHLQREEDGDLDLTLSIGYGASRNESRCGSHSDRGSGAPESTYGGAREPILSKATRAKQEECSEAHVSFENEVLQRSTWPFQTLSLNKT